ncbi:MAG: hypothetical protein HY044_02795 [Candidatus Woesebacteria bacterium]|nr:MAG: hypothetical protein HY044_02795 [Candidatus Woesebacteria bacterium]
MPKFQKKIFLILILSFIFRLILIPVAHHGDLNNNISWGNEALVRGFINFYESKNWPYSVPNQPPLYIFLFTISSFLYKYIGTISFFLNDKIGIFPSSFIWFWQNSGMDILVKLPGILADLVIGYLIYKKTNLKLTILWLFNPITWYLSSIWGQTDSVVNLFGLISIFFLLKRDLIKFSIFYTISLLFKPSLLILSPVLLVIAIIQKYKKQIWIKSIIYSSIIIILSSILFHPKFDLPIWLFNLYKDRFISGEIGDLQANAFNFWWLIDSKKVLDSTIYLGLPARVLGYLITIAAIIPNLFFLKKKFLPKNIFILLALSALITFLFMTRIHERYLYPFFPLATISLAFFNWLTIPYIILSITFFLNLYHLFYAPSIPVLESLYSFQFFPVILSLINILTFGYLLFKLSKIKTNL